MQVNLITVLAYNVNVSVLTFHCVNHIIVYTSPHCYFPQRNLRKTLNTQNLMSWSSLVKAQSAT